MGKVKWWKKKKRTVHSYSHFKSQEKESVSVVNISNAEETKGTVSQHSNTRKEPNRGNASAHRGGSTGRERKRTRRRWKLKLFGCCASRKGSAKGGGGSAEARTTDRTCGCSALLRWSGLLCCCSWCRCWRCCSNSTESCWQRKGGNDDEDVDAAFEAYKLQLGGTTVALAGSANAAGPDYDALSPSQKSTIRKLNKNASWGWNDSFRSVSDRFLESLELDDVSSGDNSLRKKFSVCCRKRLASPFRESKAILGEIELG